MRALFLDTETTGLDEKKERVIEIGIIEVVDGEMTGNYYHAIINPLKKISSFIEKLTGISNETVSDKPTFIDIYDTLIDFIGDDYIIFAHNSSFDMKMLNAEFKRMGKPIITMDKWVDTIKISKQLKPARSHSLDAICKREKVSLKERDVHSAIIDAKILFHVYKSLTKDVSDMSGLLDLAIEKPKVKMEERKPVKFPVRIVGSTTREERDIHKEFVRESIPNAIWNEYIL